MPSAESSYVGRFAPSPTGPLHFGSLVAALASYLDARAQGGRWLLRMEDVDRPREVPGAATSILDTLRACALYWDGSVMRQSTREPAYRAAFERLRDTGRVYPCACTRKEIADSRIASDGTPIYPGTCRNGLPAGRSPRAWRLRVEAGRIEFVDRLQGRRECELASEAGDFVVLRADGLFAYQLAVVVDDAEQGVTDVVRGADLLESTARQLYLQRLLGYPTPRYLHVPVAVNAQGEKLSKQTRAAAIDDQHPLDALRRALAFLGQAIPAADTAAAMLALAAQSWSAERIAAQPSVVADPKA